MPVRLEWVDPEQTLIYIVAEGHLSPDEVLSAANLLREMVQSVDHPVEAIIDARKQTFFSRRYGEMLRRVHQPDYPNLRMVVFVGASFVWELFLTFARQFGSVPYRFAMKPTYEEAVELIQRFRLEADMPSASSACWN